MEQVGLTAEERAAMRARCEDATDDWDFNEHQSEPIYFGDTLICLTDTYDGWRKDTAMVSHARADILRTLDALDAAEARARELEDQVSALVNNSHLGDKLHAAEARAQKAEADRQAEVARLRGMIHSINLQRYIEVIATTHPDIVAVLREGKDGE